MKNLIIKASKDTPSVEFQTNGILSLDGKSYPENASEFYEQITFWIEEYFFHHEPQDTTISFNLTYFNFSSFQILLEIFETFEAHSESSNIIINWFYVENDDSSLEDGENFKDKFPNLNIRLLVCG